MESYFQKTTAKPKAKANGKKQQKEKVVGMVQTAKVNRTVTTKYCSSFCQRLEESNKFSYRWRKN